MKTKNKTRKGGHKVHYDYKGNLIQKSNLNSKNNPILTPIPCAQEFKHSFEDFQVLNNH